MTRRNRRIVLDHRPVGMVSADCFRADEVDVPELGEGQALLKVSHIGIDPTIRQWIDTGNYLPPIEIGEPIRAATIGRIVESRHDRFPVGALATCLTGWEEWSVIDGDSLTHNVVPERDPVQLISVLGATSVTAWLGVTQVAKPAPGETMVVSAAAGSVGSVVCQLSTHAGASVIGIAGTDAKCAWLTDDLGCVGAINYRTTDVAAALKELAPAGVDVFFDNVGGDVLDAVLRRLATHARVVLCGNVAAYNLTERLPGPANFDRIMAKRATVSGFNTIDHLEHYLDGVNEVARLADEGVLRGRVDLVDGLDRAPEALVRLFTGDHLGKLVVQVSEPLPAPKQM